MKRTEIIGYVSGVTAMVVLLWALTGKRKQ